MYIKVFNNFDTELKNLWQNFEITAHSYPFQSYDWQCYWNQQLDKLEHNLMIFVYVCFFKKKVRAIFPLGVRKVWRIKVLEFLGGEVTDFNSPLIAADMKQIEFKKIWLELNKFLPNHDIICFNNIPEFFGNNKNLLLRNLDSKIVNKSFYAILPNNVDDYFSTLSKNLLKDNKRMVRRLNEKGKLHFNVIDNAKDFSNIITTMINQKIKRYHLTGNRNIFQSKSIHNFYSNLYYLYKTNFNIHLSTLVLDEEVLAVSLGIIYKNEFYYIFPTFNNDKKWSKFSLGRIHLEKLIHWTIYNKINKIDFTIGIENYKSIWCKNDMNVYKYLKIKSFKGCLYYLKELIIDFIKSNKILKKIALKTLNIFHQNTAHKKKF